jgi:hypothetical protein
LLVAAPADKPLPLWLPLIPSSLPRRRFFVISFEMSLILVNVVLGLSGGKLAALDCVVPRVPLTARLVVEALTSLRELARLVLLPDLPPAESRSNTLELPDGFGDSLLGRDDRRSMIELLLGSAFFNSFKDLPGRIFPWLSVTSSSILMIGTDVTYFPSTRVES